MSYLIYDHRRNGLTCLELSPNETKKCLALIGEKTPAPIGLRPMPMKKNIFAELDKELKANKHLKIGKAELSRDVKKPDFRKSKIRWD